jgi:uncharacterized membrane protein YphA (DoxX/SURF4 family)
MATERENLPGAPVAEGRVSRWLLVVLRLHLGIILLLTVTGKLTGDGPFSEQLLGFVRRGAGRGGLYGGFLREVVIPHATLFSYLVMNGELFAGLSLLLGAVTRLGAGVAMFLFVNYMLAKGRWFWSPDSEDAAVFLSALVVLIGAAGRTFGIDAVLRRRWPSVPLW